MQHSFVEKPNSNKPVTIEVNGEPLGIVIPEPEGYRFLAVRFNAFGIDGQTFATVEEARAAARQAQIPTSAVHPLPAERALRQYPPAGVPPSEMPEVLLQVPVLVDPARIRHSVVARPPIPFIPVTYQRLLEAAGLGLASLANPDIPECQTHFCVLLSLRVHLLSTILAGEHKRTVRDG